MTIFTAGERLLRWLMVLIIATMVVLVFLNVVLRYGFNSNLMLTEELGRYFFVWLTFIGAITAFARNRHVQVDTLVRRMPPAMQRGVRVVSDLAMLVCCVLILLGCWKLTVLNMRNYLPISEISVSALYFAGIPAAVCIGGMLLCRLWRTLFRYGEDQGEAS